MIEIKSMDSYKSCHNSTFIVKRETNESTRLIQCYADFCFCCIVTLTLMVVVLSIIRQLSNLFRMNFITKINRGDSWMISQITIIKIGISLFNKKVIGVAVILGDRNRFIMAGPVVSILFQEGHLSLPDSILLGFLNVFSSC